MLSDRRSWAMDDSLPPFLRDRLQALSKLERHAESFGGQLTKLKDRLTRDWLEPGDGALGGEPVHKPTILVADDRPAPRAIAEEILEALGYRVLLTNSQLDNAPIDVKIDAVLIDVPCLSADSGTRIQNARQWSDRVIVSTLLPDGPARQYLRDVGARGVVSKPLDPREVGRCLQAVFG